MAKPTPTLRYAKWIAAPACASICFLIQAIFLYFATMHYIERHEKNPLMVEPLYDVGHELVGLDTKISLVVLDCFCFGGLAIAVFSCVLLGELRLWTRFFLCLSFLFLIKGFLDFVTVIPDSIGWEQCVARLHKGVKPDKAFGFVQLAKEIADRSETGFIKILNVVMVGLNGEGGFARGKPVRFCGDMMVSGHTGFLVLAMLVVADVSSRVAYLFVSPLRTRLFQLGTQFLAVLLVMWELYLVAKNHFHYTVDVVAAVIICLLLYTNSAVGVFVDWFVEAGEEEGSYKTVAEGDVWIPGVCVPFCCFSGFYDIQSLSSEEILRRQQENKSRFWKWAAQPPNHETASTPLTLESSTMDYNTA